MSGGPSPDGFLRVRFQILRSYAQAVSARGASVNFNSASARSGSSI
eukprot:SAG31_NODE_3065_length_4728_cov_2.260531_6_plen_46_part_00